jgi:hypothetical protein
MWLAGLLEPPFLLPRQIGFSRSRLRNVGARKCDVELRQITQERACGCS